jgi:hypothetical protein
MTNSRLLPLAIIFFALSSLPLSAQTVTSFDGIAASQLANPEYDVDPNGAVGTKQFMQYVNLSYQAYDKITFAPVWSSPQPVSTPFAKNGLKNCGFSGDGMIIFDRLASRWVIAGHTGAQNNYYYCVAVSSTDDLTSSSLTWYTYQIALNSILGKNAEGNVYFPDWPKIATWPDAYYVTIDLNDVNANYEEVGVVVCALDRTNMLINGTPNPPQCFSETSPLSNGVYLGHSVIPADVDGSTAPPVGRDEFMVSIENPVIDNVTTTSSTFNLWDFHVNWTNRSLTTFTQSAVSVAPYTPGCYQVHSPVQTICVPEPSTSSTGESIDSVGDRFMPRFAYRNFGSYESFLFSHDVQVGTGSKQTGIRWYELRGSGTPSVFQDGTISPDTTNYRFIPSIAEDSVGNAAAGYSISSSTTHPGLSASWWSLTNATAPVEFTLYSGGADLENTWHWGSYDSMTVDPVDGCTFWYVNEYYPQNQTGSLINWHTRIANFQLPGCGSVALAPSSLTFPAQALGTTSPAQTITLTNSQSVALNISSFSFTGANFTNFAQTNTCGSAVSAGASCTISVTFTPSASGTLMATLNVNDDGPNSPQSASLTGTGTSGAILSISPGSINFGNQVTGATSGIFPVQVMNTGGGAATFTNIAITGTNIADFAQSNNCLPSLPAQQSCTVNLTFTPKANGTRSASLTFTDNAGNSPQNVGLSGVGVAPVTLSATSLNFGTVLVKSSGTSPTVTLTNNQSIALSNISITISGSAAFTQVNTCGSSIPALGQCGITVTFAPTAAGSQTATLNIADSASNSPQSVGAKGSGELPVAMSPTLVNFGDQTVGTTSATQTITVTNNQKVTLTFTSVTLSGADKGDFAQTNTCSSIAAGSQCAVTLTFTPLAKGIRTATLTLNDSAATSPQTAKIGGTGE